MLSVRAGLRQLSMEKQSLGKSTRPCEEAFVLVSGKREKRLFPFLFRWPGTRQVTALSGLGRAAPRLTLAAERGRT